jgi:hypothetical protein
VPRAGLCGPGAGACGRDGGGRAAGGRRGVALLLRLGQRGRADAPDAVRAPRCALAQHGGRTRQQRFAKPARLISGAKAHQSQTREHAPALRLPPPPLQQRAALHAGRCARGGAKLSAAVRGRYRLDEVRSALALLGGMAAGAAPPGLSLESGAPAAGFLAGRLDLASIAIGGHSYGGATAVATAAADARIRAVVALDPWWCATALLMTALPERALRRVFPGRLGS